MKCVINQYCSRVGRLLCCLPQTRKEVLKGLREELEELPGAGSMNLETLEEYYGTVAQIADELQYTIPLEEQRVAQTRKKYLHYTAVLVLVAMVVTSLAFAIHANLVLKDFKSNGYIVYELLSTP